MKKSRTLNSGPAELLLSVSSILQRAILASTGCTLFFIPFLQAGRAQRPDKIPHHTLVQVFLDCQVPDLSPWLVHTRFFGWNDAYAPDMCNKFGFGIGAFPLFSVAFLQTSRCADISALGRLAGSSRIHFVDASFMPAIPASTITLSVMANAHRIVSFA